MIKFLGRTAGNLYNKVWNRSKSSNQGKSQKSDDFYITKRKLPPNFADDLLNLEIEIEQGKYVLADINKLIQLYSVAIEYYESIVSSKHYIFQNKLKTLMSNPQVMETINEEYCKNSKKKDPFVLSHKEKAENFHQEYLKNAAKELHMNRFRESLSDKIATVEGLINGQISNQQELIMKRLEERKKNVNRPKSQPPSTRITEEDATTPVFSKKKEQSPKFKKGKEELAKIKKNLYKEEENKRNEGSPVEKFKISQTLKVVEQEQGQKLSRKKKTDDIAFKIMNTTTLNKNSPAKEKEKNETNLPKNEQVQKKEEKATNNSAIKDNNPAFRLFKKPQK